MTAFLLIRHGETDAAGKLLMGWMPGWHLNPHGKQQAEKLAERLSHLPIRAVYTSPLERAIETAMPIAQKHALSPEPLTELGELRMGEWEGMSFAELEGREDWQRFNVYRSGSPCPGGEFMAETQTRMIRQLDSLRQRHTRETVAIVSHADPLRAVVAYVLGIPLDLMQRFEIGHASVSVVEMADWGSRVMCLNVAAEGTP